MENIIYIHFIQCQFKHFLSSTTFYDWSTIFSNNRLHRCCSKGKKARLHLLQHLFEGRGRTKGVRGNYERSTRGVQSLDSSVIPLYSPCASLIVPSTPLSKRVQRSARGVRAKCALLKSCSPLCCSDLYLRKTLPLVGNRERNIKLAVNI
jgi:hypothetical protein